MSLVLQLFIAIKMIYTIHWKLSIEQKVLNQEEKKKGKGSSRLFSNFKSGMALKQISLVVSKGVDFPLIDFFAHCRLPSLADSL